MRLRADNSRLPFKLAVPAASTVKIGRSAGRDAGVGISCASILSFASITFVRILTNTLHSIALHLEDPDLSALPVHLRVLATFTYSALIKQTS